MAFKSIQRPGSLIAIKKQISAAISIKVWMACVA
jgi:hypothetical protein